MGIGGSIMDSKFMEEYFGMRVESVDEVEVIRRMTLGIYDHAEYEKLRAWAKENVIEGFDKNPENLQKTREQKDQDWEFTLKMYLIIKDLAIPICPKAAKKRPLATTPSRAASRDSASGRISIRTAISPKRC